jgi:hypothetical protein
LIKSSGEDNKTLKIHKWEPSWLKDEKLGLYSEKYQVKQVGKWLSNISILYELEQFKPEYDCPL